MSGTARAQAPTAPGQATQTTALVKVFLDCGHCDTEFLKQNVAFVDYVRDRAVADVHVLVTMQGTGGGGLAWTLAFIGVGKSQGQDRSLSFTTASTATSDEQRKEFARVFKLGLVSYAAESAVFKELDVNWRRPVLTGESPAGGQAATRDPWHYWVFSVSGGANADGESRSNSRSYRMSFSANRTTEQWKISISSNRNTDRSAFEFDDGTKVTTRRQSWGLSTLTVKSLGPKWSVGVRAGASHSSFSNTDRSVHVRPGLEFNFFPYSESSRRSATVQYNAGPEHFKYREVTIFDKLSETVPRHDLSFSVGIREPWGSVNGHASVSQHLNNTRRWRGSVFLATDVRLFKGFSFNVFGGYDKIRDQIGLTKGGASTEDVLLRLRQLNTSYSYNFNVGLSYRFGSIFNSIVNPRFGGGGGEGMMMFFF